MTTRSLPLLLVLASCASVPSGAPTPVEPVIAVDHDCPRGAAFHLAEAAEAPPERGVHELRRALAHDPGSIEAIRALAATAGRAGDRSLQAASLAVWMELDRADPRPCLALGELFLAAGDPTSAGDLAREAQRRDPDDPAAHVLRSEAHLAAGELAAARSALDAACELGRCASTPLASREGNLPPPVPAR